LSVALNAGRLSGIWFDRFGIVPIGSAALIDSLPTGIHPPDGLPENPEHFSHA
jgi:hypothetical protein